MSQSQSEIAKRFLSDAYRPGLMIWGDAERAIGERMIVQEHGKVLGVGYATFRERCESTFAAWCERLRNELPQESARARLRDVQHLLYEFVETLETRRIRYTQDLEPGMTRCVARSGSAAEIGHLPLTGEPWSRNARTVDE